MSENQPTRREVLLGLAAVPLLQSRLESGHSIRRLTIRRLPRGRFVVDIVATRSNGTRLVSTRTYHGCAKSRPHLRLGRSRHHRKRS